MSVSGRMLALAVAMGLAAAAPFAALHSQSTNEGKDLFARRCGGCHNLDSNKVGPRLRGVYGRAAGSLKSFSYSEELKKANFTWNDDTLDKWLTNTESLVPGNDMTFRVESPDERKTIIAYLRANRDQ